MIFPFTDKIYPVAGVVEVVPITIPVVTCNLALGAEVPTPTLPLLSNINEAALKKLVSPGFPLVCELLKESTPVVGRLLQLP